MEALKKYLGVLSLINAVVVSLAANGGYDLITKK